MKESIEADAMAELEEGKPVSLEEPASIRLTNRPQLF